MFKQIFVVKFLRLCPLTSKIFCHIWYSFWVGELSWFSQCFTQSRIFYANYLKFLYNLWHCQLAIGVYKHATMKVMLPITILHFNCKSFPTWSHNNTVLILTVFASHLSPSRSHLARAFCKNCTVLQEKVF